MMIDLASEAVITLAQATKHLPRRRRQDKKPHVSTVYRWATAGARGVVLETLRVGGTLCTSIEALQRFCERCTYASPAQVPALKPSVAPLAPVACSQIRGLGVAGLFLPWWTVKSILGGTVNMVFSPD